METVALLEPVFNHLVLPPKLPGKQDIDIAAIEQCILTRLITACETLAKLATQKSAERWGSIRQSLRICRNINPGRLEKASMLHEFRNLSRKDILILHVVEQNAALLIRRHTNDGTDTVIFEVFEASPSSEDVLAAENALQWDFPGRAVEIPFDEFLKSSFRESLATFLEQASTESLNRFKAHASKAKKSVIEVRDTADPALITQMLMPLLEAVGSPIDVPRLRKRVRDDVNIQNAELPWRRLPFWLVLRVATERQLCLAHGNETGRAYYKFLICTVLAQLLEDSVGKLSPELTVALKAKLCRRLAKLEMDKTRPNSPSATYAELFGSTSPMLKSTLQKASRMVESAWANFRATIARSVPTLPARADENSLYISLPNSGSYLDNLLDLPRVERRYHASLRLPPSVDGTMDQMTRFTDRYFDLAGMESRIETDRTSAPDYLSDCQARCIELAESILEMFSAVGESYDSNPEQMSGLILNLIDLWVQMDECAIKVCPLLREYAPVFKSEVLDVLQLPLLSSMERLQNIQKYLLNRRNNCRFADKTIFSEPDENCFAARYVEQSAPLCTLSQQIEAASKKSRDNKKSEWRNACDEYDNLTEKISNGTCVCTIDRNGSRNVKGCTKCWHRRCRKRMSISIHEDFLPNNDPLKAAVVFELGIPRFFEAYRNATFAIFNNLGHPSKPINSSSPEMLLKDYSQLRYYLKATVNGFTLASAKKSFLQTHYKAVKMKVDISDILLPLGLDFAYYDIKSGFWLKNLDKELTFQHLCGIHIPRSLHGSIIPLLVHPAPNFEGPSSYETMASQTKCPSDMSIHEFTGFQRLLSGMNRRWLTLLVELGASNLNFNCEDTMHIFNHLAVQAGSAQNEGHALRDAHYVFQDRSFCQRLTEQIEKRLRNITCNWRDTRCMEILISLSLRLFNLTSGRDQESAKRLLNSAREITLRWISRLRDEVRNAAEAATAETAARYGLWAALLCRRTFAIYVESDLHIDENELCSFVQASVALQENVVGDLTKLPINMKNMLVRDVKMVYRMQQLVKKSILSNPNSLGAAINKTWSDPGNSTGRAYSHWQFLPYPNQRWVVSNITSTTNVSFVSQVVHYNFVEGHLLVDGKPLGRLPLEIRESVDVRELFEDQHLLTYPSSLDGMSHAMSTPIEGGVVHFGLRGKNVVIRFLSRDALLEYVPRKIFRGNDNHDLPLGLIDPCVHWLNIRTKCLEIRRKPCIWITRKNDWILDLSNRRAWRNRVSLIDPNSDLAKRIAGVFRHFEDPKWLTIYQPSIGGSLSVELRRLELSFFVNRKNLLQCRELRAEIDPNQDAGTFYGFQSMIVLRDVADIERRSIITALGKLTYRRDGMHVAVRADSINDYARFRIDAVLGRISCPPEPRLLYSKALFHAFTSFPLPDPLTGRTGTEEALHTLRSGSSQPWIPVEGPIDILRRIEQLSPGREYYPRDKKLLQTVTWEQNLTVDIQHDSYQAIIQEILTKSDRLRAFTEHNDKSIDLAFQRPSHLRRRSEIRRSLYERSIVNSTKLTSGNNMIYKPRDQQTNLPQASYVYQIVSLIRKQPFGLYMRKKLASILQEWKLIGGFHCNSDREGMPICLSDMIESNIGEEWGSIVSLCQRTDAHDPYQMIFRLALLSFGARPDMNAIQSMAAFGCVDELKTLQPPLGDSFAKFELHESPTFESLLKFIEADYPDLEPNTRHSLKQETLFRESHRVKCETEGTRLARFLLKQWPCADPSVDEFEPTVLDVTLALERILPEWQRLRQNLGLSEYIVQAQEILDQRKGTADASVPRAWNPDSTVFCVPHRAPVIPSLSGDLLLKCGPISHSNLSPNHEIILGDKTPRGARPINERTSIPPKAAPSKEVSELGRILGSFAQSPDILRQQYGSDLKRSLAALVKVSDQHEHQLTPPSISTIIDCIGKVRMTLKLELESIQNAYSANDNRLKWLKLGGLWPCVTLITLLEQLRSRSDNQFGSNMKEALVTYGVLITTLQRLLRIRHAQLKGDHQKMLEEWGNSGHENWSPLKLPDWLLLEIESDLLIRPEQIDVAHAIISPASGSNSVLQMNMGKGKTSCIVPMAVAILADKKRLSRLIVPKALLLQTAQTVQSRLGGLVGREIRHIPFSRRTMTAPNMLQLYSEHHCETLRCCGIILTTPEHILSFKLSGLQRLTDFRLEEAQEMIQFQSWLTETCRDVLDESDFTLAVKTQLIYPSGPQISVDGHPHRWIVAQILLSLVEDHLPRLLANFPRSIDVVKRPRGFPVIHFLQPDVEDSLHRSIINDICNGRVSFLRLADSALAPNKVEIKRVLSEEHLDSGLIDRVAGYFVDKSSARKNVLFVRGLLLNRILLLCLKKRWNVQYGLHPNRDPVAVPFEAKGVPSELAEFGHPDVSILFTCLAFYYSGLTTSQFREALQLVLKSDDPAAEYDRWTHSSATLPDALHHWNAINGDDQGQVEELWRHLRLDRNVLNHYMNNFVFPIHAKQFGVKLQASGWDLPLFPKPRPGAVSRARTTGFSGTNDNKMMLPLNIKQDDLPNLLQTNAEVLTYLLQGRNRQYNLAATQGRRLTEEDLLKSMARSNIRILIDAGAYILEMDNETLVKQWLKVDTQAKGAVYFGTDNRAWVQYRGGKASVPLFATPFSENLDECLVYIDEAHTRGTDLKLPQKACGALTLALGQTKDHTVQAAMRLRQLGSTQSVVFFAPPEVHQSILDTCKQLYGNISDSFHVDSSHVVSWLLEQTCRVNENLKHLYLAQGSDYCRRTSAQWESVDLLTDTAQREAFLRVIQHPERQTLEQLYGAVADNQPSTLAKVSSTELICFMEEIAEQRRAGKNNGNPSHSSVLEEVEQEREVEFQVEEVRQVQQPEHYKALPFPGLHTAVSHFSRTGELTGGHGYEHVFEALAHTSIGQKYDVCGTASQLFVSSEFMRTIVIRKRVPKDIFLRPVEWVLWSPSNETALIVISEEVELLIPIIRAATEPKVHLMTYAAPVTKTMLHFNGLRYYVLPRLPAHYTVPDWLSIELGIFAGRLYFNFSEVGPLTRYLRLAEETDKELVHSSKGHRDVFTKDPVDFLLEWLPFRRMGQDILHTPIGYICQGRPLHENHPFFVARSSDVGEARISSVGDKAGDDSDEAELEDEEVDLDD